MDVSSSEHQDVTIGSFHLATRMQQSSMFPSLRYNQCSQPLEQRKKDSNNCLLFFFMNRSQSFWTLALMFISISCIHAEKFLINTK